MLIEQRWLFGINRYYIVAVVLFLIWSILYLNEHEHLNVQEVVGTSLERLTRLANSSSILFTEKQAGLETAVQAVFKTIKINPTQRFFRDSKGRYFASSKSNKPTWARPLGKKILVVDIDTRVPDGDNQIFHPGAETGQKIDWDSLPARGEGLVSHAIANHYLYAMIHGYEYRYYQALNMPDHHPTWIQPHIVKALLPDYQFIVTMDADAVISHLEVPLEWMFNRWGIAKHTSIALPHDTEEFKNGKSISTDSKGVLVLNTGFVVTQNLPKTFEILNAWANCTTEKRYPGCARWKHEWSHEQRAFSEYIRYDYGKVPQTIVGIPCDDAVGYPNFVKYNRDKGAEEPISDCNGNFIRHYTLGKDQVHAGATTTIAQAFAEVLQKSLMNGQDEYVMKEEEESIAAWEGGDRPKQAWEEGGRSHKDEKKPKDKDEEKKKEEEKKKKEKEEEEKKEKEEEEKKKEEKKKDEEEKDEEHEKDAKDEVDRDDESNEENEKEKDEDENEEDDEKENKDKDEDDDKENEDDDDQDNHSVLFDD